MTGVGGQRMGVDIWGCVVVWRFGGGELGGLGLELELKAEGLHSWL